MEVNESWRDNQALGVEDFVGFFADLTNCCNLSVADKYVRYCVST
jgi:hypothetical protein